MLARVKQGNLCMVLEKGWASSFLWESGLPKREATQRRRWNPSSAALTAPLNP